VGTDVMNCDLLLAWHEQRGETGHNLTVVSCIIIAFQLSDFQPELLNTKGNNSISVPLIHCHFTQGKFGSGESKTKKQRTKGNTWLCD